MMSEATITIDGYEFDISIYVRASVLIGYDAPLDDKGYIKALRKVQKLLHYFAAVHVFHSMGEQAGIERILDVIEAYEKKLIPVALETYQAAISFRNGNPVRRNQPQPAPKPLKEGYVYLVKSPSGFYKIGKTVDPNDRIKTFTVKLPFEVEMIHTIKTKQYHALEKFLHTKFDDKRANGEWFALLEEDVEYIKSLAVQA